MSLPKITGTGVLLKPHPAPDQWVSELEAEAPLEARRLASRLAEGNTLLVMQQVFGEIQRDDDHIDRVWGSYTGPETVGLEQDPTGPLIEAAYRARAGHLGDLMRPLKQAGTAASRWHLYAAPFRVELDPELEESLARYLKVG